MTDGPLPSRYDRQVILTELGEEGQRRLLDSTVTIIGCGGLGGGLADLLVRAGVGRARLVDRDVVELHNLHRQILFTEEDARRCLPKAEAAAARLRAVNSEIEIEAHPVDVTPVNVEALVKDADLVLDATDNIETRYIVNDACLEHGVPWIYGGAVGTTGMTMNILPGEGPCLACVFPEPAPPGSLPTCDTRGVLNALPTLIASVQVCEAIKILSHSDAVSRDLTVIDPWVGSQQRIKVERNPECRACVKGEREYLAGWEVSEETRLCSRNSIQIDPVQDLGVSLETLADRLRAAGEVEFNGHLVRFCVEDYELLIFANGRAIVRGTTEPKVARGLYAKYVGT